MAPMVIAHRTCPRDAPENSLQGIAVAAASGADAVEVDVRRAGDGTPMLLHDRWLLRTTGVPARLEWLRSAQVQRLRMRGGGRVPTFAEALEAIGSNLRIAIDVKDAGAADAVLSEIRNQHKEPQVLFWSQHEQAVRTAVSGAPELEVSLLRDTKTPEALDRFLADAGAFGATGISAHWSQVSPGLAQRCAAAGLALYAWCKREQIDADRLALLAGVVTDWPRAARSAVSMLDGPS